MLVVAVERRSDLDAGQQLMLDLVMCSADILNNEETLVRAATTIASLLEIEEMVRLDVTELEPEGYGIMANCKSNEAPLKVRLKHQATFLPAKRPMLKILTTIGIIER